MLLSDWWRLYAFLLAVCCCVCTILSTAGFPASRSGVVCVVVCCGVLSWVGIRRVCVLKVLAVGCLLTKADVL